MGKRKEGGVRKGRGKEGGKAEGELHPTLFLGPDDVSE